MCISEEISKIMTKKILHVADVVGYVLPRYVKGKSHYVEFYCFDPEREKLVRKKTMFDHIKNTKERNASADRFCKEVALRLQEGWNPFVERTGESEYTLFEVACSKYEEFLDKLERDQGYRVDTTVGYRSKLRILQDWMKCQSRKAYYSYQFDEKMVSRFLDYVYVERNNTITTRNNYYNWLLGFCKYLKQHHYISNNPMENFDRITNRKTTKNRTVIPDATMIEIRDYLMEHNKHYLLACYILHYILIRPKEMTFLRINDISIKDATIRLYGDHTKNYNDAILTIPKKVLHLMIDLRIFDCPGNWYLFSHGFTPGPEKIDQKRFRDFWTRRLRDELGFSNSYKFYSLKDTGVTNMLKSNVDVLSVRDQARHSSILITDIYTPHDLQEANKVILNYDGQF